MHSLHPTGLRMTFSGGAHSGDGVRQRHPSVSATPLVSRVSPSSPRYPAPHPSPPASASPAQPRRSLPTSATPWSPPTSCAGGPSPSRRIPWIGCGACSPSAAPAGESRGSGGCWECFAGVGTCCPAGEKPLQENKHVPSAVLALPAVLHARMATPSTSTQPACPWTTPAWPTLTATFSSCRSWWADP